MPVSARQPPAEWPKLSGPHICASVGQQALDLARKSLVNAAEIRGGQLSVADIAMVFDFLANAPDMFDLFRTNYEACGKIHRKQTFVGAKKDFFAVSVLRFLCFDILRQVFQPQINRAGQGWEMAFLHAFAIYICNAIDPKFVAKLTVAYRNLAKKHGSDITALTIAHDPAIRAIVQDVSGKFPLEHIDHVNFSNAINKALSDKFEDYGPSPIKVSEPFIERFFKAIRSGEQSNYFRKTMLG